MGISRTALWQWARASKLHPLTVPHVRETSYAQEEIHHAQMQRQIRQDAARAVPDDAYTATQVCQILGIAAATLNAWYHQGKLSRRRLPCHRAAVYPKPEVVIPVPCPPDAAQYTQLYTHIWQLPDDARGDKRCSFVAFLSRESGVPYAEVEDVVQHVFVKLWEDGADFFARHPTVTKKTHYPDSLLPGGRIPDPPKAGSLQKRLRQ